jgi:hypothetical protein
VISVFLAVDQGGRFKGTGWVEFEDRDSLIVALNKNETPLNNRALRITVQEPRSFNATGGQGGYNKHRENDSSEPLKSDENNWRREREPETESFSSYKSGSGQQNRSNRYQSGGSQYSEQRQGYGQRRNDNRGGSSSGYGADRRGGRQDDGQQRRPYSNMGHNRNENRPNRYLENSSEG